VRGSPPQRAKTGLAGGPGLGSEEEVFFLCLLAFTPQRAMHASTTYRATIRPSLAGLEHRG
jgi:hypothetical protein